MIINKNAKLRYEAIRCKSKLSIVNINMVNGNVQKEPDYYTISNAQEMKELTDSRKTRKK